MTESCTEEISGLAQHCFGQQMPIHLTESCDGGHPSAWRGPGPHSKTAAAAAQSSPSPQDLPRHGCTRNMPQSSLIVKTSHRSAS